MSFLVVMKGSEGLTFVCSAARQAFRRGSDRSLEHVNVELVRRLSADLVIDYSKESFEDDVIFLLNKGP